MGALSKTFNRFFESEKSGGYLLVACTVLALAVSNSPLGPDYLRFWQREAGGLSLQLWVNDALMAVFVLLIGLELERELYVGELSSLHNALLPVVAALGGMVAPALIHFALNAGTPTQDGFGIPMATDIAFALGVLAVLGSRIPASLRVSTPRGASRTTSSASSGIAVQPNGSNSRGSSNTRVSLAARPRSNVSTTSVS